MDEADDPVLQKHAEVIQERGYLVLAFNNVCPIGMRVTTWRYDKNNLYARTNHPLVIAAVTNREDWITQAVFVYGSRKEPTPGYIYFYRCTTD